MSNEGILLESGTNEVEILEFIIAGQSFGVNVLKIQAIEQHDPGRVTTVQLARPSIAGTLLFRDRNVPLIDLTRELQSSGDLAAGGPAAGTRLVLVMEFNNQMTAFLVDGVHRIHRISWESISPMSSFLSSGDSKFTGSLQIEGREVLIMDMEKIVTEVLPDTRPRAGAEEIAGNPHFRARAGLQIFLAEDSSVIAERVANELKRCNYLQVTHFANGMECFNRLEQLNRLAAESGSRPAGFPDAVISDIEMPRMDGLALCRNIKEFLKIRNVPVIMFSSLINEQIALKCREVSADAYLAKPQFTELVGLLDAHCLDAAACHV